MAAKLLDNRAARARFIVSHAIHEEKGVAFLLIALCQFRNTLQMIRIGHNVARQAGRPSSSRIGRSILAPEGNGPTAVPVASAEDGAQPRLRERIVIPSFL